MLARLKQQAQETGVFFKKQQLAFSQQVQKGIKKAAGLTSGQKKDELLQHPDMTLSTSINANVQCDAPLRRGEPEQASFDQMSEWVSALGQMGFQKEHIREAASMLGGQPEHFDDLLQVVVATASSDESTCTKGASSNTKPSCSSMVDDEPLEQEPFLGHAVHGPSEAKDVSLEALPPLPPPLSPPPLPSMSSCGSATFENAEDKATFLHSAPPRLDTRIFDHFQQMGFESETIHAAFRLLGKEATVDDFFELLLHMPEANQVSANAPMDISVSSSQDVYDVSGYESEEDQVDRESVPGYAFIEPSTKDLAAVIVAAAIAKAACTVPCMQQTPVATKQILEHPSPVRGGA
jgi:hypothetical protein